MSLFRTVLSFGLLISFSSTAFGDISGRFSSLPTPPMVAPVKIVEGKVDDIDPDAVAKIIIPSSLLPDLQEPSYGTQVSNESDGAGMVLAGLAFSAFAISLMFAFKDSPHRKKGMVALIACVLLVLILVLSNFFFPAKSIASSADPSKTQPRIIIEVQQEGHEVILILPSRK